MATAKKAKPAEQSVDDYMRALEHPLKAEMQALREIILGASAKITEGIKWNAPSFACGEHFATFNPRAKDGVQVILHFGAKVKDMAKPAIDDPAGLLQWLGKDRASLKLRDMTAIKKNSSALKSLVRAWIKHLQ